MKRLSNRLQEFIAEAPSRPKHRDLTVKEMRLFRSLKTQGERATKGRLVSECQFESRNTGRVKLMMIMEGRHSMSVGSQIARRFEKMDEVESANLVRTKDGARVVLCLKDMES